VSDAEAAAFCMQHAGCAQENQAEETSTGRSMSHTAPSASPSALLLSSSAPSRHLSPPCIPHVTCCNRSTHQPDVLPLPPFCPAATAMLEKAVQQRPWLADHVRLPLASRPERHGSPRKRPYIYVYDLADEFTSRLLQYRVKREACTWRMWGSGGEKEGCGGAVLYAARWCCAVCH
jgi:hypothetical protein